MLNEQLEVLLRQLNDEELRRIAIAKLECYKNADIVEELGCSPRTVERRLELIRQKWSS